MLLSNKNSKIPRGIVVILYTEIQELFGRFGITALLVLYLTKQLHLADSSSFTIYSLFLAAIFLTPIVGGYVADKILGYNRSVVLGGIVMTIGNLLLIIPQLTAIKLGLVVVAIGSGLFTPSLAALLSRLYIDREQQREQGFTLYYICKNLGALLAPLLCGLIAHIYNYNYAFILSSFAMLSGVIVFIVGNKRLPYIPLPRSVEYDSEEQIRVKYFGCLKEIMANKKIRYIALLMLFVIIFSTLLGQGGTTLNLYIDRIVNRSLFGITIPTSFFYTLDPIFMLLLGPILAFFFLSLERNGHRVETLSKIALAMMVLAGGFLIFALSSLVALHNGKVSMLYIVAAYFLFPLAELCIMPIALAAITRAAPQQLQAMVIGVFMLAQAIAGYLTGVVSRLGQVTFEVTTRTGLQQAAHIYLDLFLITASILLVAGLVLLVARRSLKRLAQADAEVKAADENLAPVITALET